MTLDGKAITREIVAQQVCKIIESTRPRLAGLIHPDTVLTPELGIDSLAMIEMTVGIEEQFGIAMGDMEELDVERPSSVEELIDLVMTKLQAAAQ